MPIVSEHDEGVVRSEDLWQRRRGQDPVSNLVCRDISYRSRFAALICSEWGMEPCQMERLTLARKIAAIALTLWKKEERFEAEQLKPQAA